MGSMTREYEVEETDAATLEDLNSVWFERHKDDEDYLLELQKEAAEKQNEAADLALKAAMEELDNMKSDKGEKHTLPKEDTVKTYEIEVQIGEEVLDEARARIGTEYLLGGLGDDGGGLATDCGKLVLDAFTAAGVAFENRYVPDMIEEAKRKGAWHAAGDGYVPQAGDAAVVLGDEHIVVSNGKGGYVGANSSTGVTEKNSVEADFGKVTGYISVSELTGGATLRKTVGENDKAAQEAIKKLNQAKTQATRLFQTMESEITSETKTAYEAGMAKLAENVRAKQQEINKIAQTGVDTTVLQAELAEYEHVLTEKIVNQQKEALAAVQHEEQKITAEMAGDYAALAEAQYQETVARIEKERKEKYKAIATDKNIYEEELVLNKWYNAEMLSAVKTREDALREVNKKRLQDMQDKGNLVGIKNYLSEHGERQQRDIDLAGQSELAKAYVKIWNDAHKSVSGYLADAAENVYGTLSDSLTDFIKGTKSAQDVFRDFGNSVLSMMAKIAAQRLAANIMGNIFGGGTSVAASTAYTFPTGVSYVHAPTYARPSIRAFAKGGIVTAPTLGLIGEGGEREAVIPLNERNLSALAGGQGKGANVVVNITNRSESKVRVENNRYDASLNRMILDIVVDGANRNVGGFGTNLRTALGGG